VHLLQLRPCLSAGPSVGVQVDAAFGLNAQAPAECPKSTVPKLEHAEGQLQENTSLLCPYVCNLSQAVLQEHPAAAGVSAESSVTEVAHTIIGCRLACLVSQEHFHSKIVSL
jgi:hypothetical protein